MKVIVLLGIIAAASAGPVLINSNLKQVFPTSCIEKYSFLIELNDVFFELNGVMDWVSKEWIVILKSLRTSDLVFFRSFFSEQVDYPAPHDPMINEGLFEGDILLDPNADRNAIPRDSQRWPGGVIPYFISPELASLTQRIRSAMKHIEDNSCIRFKERKDEKDHIKIFKHNGCYSHWGRIGNQNLLSLGSGCEPFGTIVHELLHAIGFEHEHNRSDRDEYLNIHWDNIVDKWYYAFKKLAPNQNRLLTTFDFNSIMLYGSNSFVKQWGKFSMTPKDGRQLPEVYDKKAMSASDAERIRKLYNC